MLLPLAPELSATTPAPDPAPLLEELATLRRENAVLRTENAVLRAESAVLHERVRELEARLGQTSANSSRPPSSDPPQAPRRQPVVPSGRKRGGQPGHRGAFRRLPPVEQVDAILAVVPERRRHGERPLSGTAARRRLRSPHHREGGPLRYALLGTGIAPVRHPARPGESGTDE